MTIKLSPSSMNQKMKGLYTGVTNKLHMEQKIYKYEVILNLLKENSHLRQLAKDLEINHMTIKRVLDGLLKENILDVKKQGRNNIFSIKKTLEAQNAVYSAELYRFNKFINKHIQLKREIIELKKLSLKLILIFGSYAKGDESKESDIDIYVETKDEKMKKIIEKINSKFSVKIGMYNKNNLLIKEIEKNHVIIKGVEDFYEKNRVFS